MSEITRRDWLALAGASYLAGSLDLEAAQHVHNAVSGANPSGAPYAPKFFQPHEYKSLRILADLIVPADAESKGALDAHAPEFIDVLCSQNEELGLIYTGGLAWLEAAMRRRYSAGFADAENKPPSFVLTVRIAPVLRALKWMVAFATGSCCESRTMPVTIA